MAVEKRSLRDRGGQRQGSSESSRTTPSKAGAHLVLPLFTLCALASFYSTRPLYSYSDRLRRGRAAIRPNNRRIYSGGSARSRNGGEIWTRSQEIRRLLSGERERSRCGTRDDCRPAEERRVYVRENGERASAVCTGQEKVDTRCRACAEVVCERRQTKIVEKRGSSGRPKGSKSQSGEVGDRRERVGRRGWM